MHDMAVTKKRVREQLLGLRLLHGTPEKEMTQEAAAQRVGTSARNWQRWEGMEVKPGPDSLSQIADAFDIPLDVFDDGKPDRSDVPLAVRLDELDEHLRRVERKLDDLALLVSGSEIAPPAELVQKLEAEAPSRAEPQPDPSRPGSAEPKPRA